MICRSEDGIAPPAPPARGHQQAIPHVQEFTQVVAGVGIIYNRAWGHRNLAVGPLRALLFGTAPVQSPIGFEMNLVRERNQGVVMRAGNKIDIAAFAAITTRRSTPGDKLLAAKGDDAVAAIAGLHIDLCFVSEHRCLGKNTRPQSGRVRVDHDLKVCRSAPA